MTAPATTTTSWSVNRRAAKAIALNARDSEEARLFLDMLGLVEGPQGREILPDDPRNYDTAFLGAVPAADPESSPIALSKKAERGDGMTTPSGLRQLPDTAAAKEAPATPRGGQLKPINHGTPGGLKAHERRGDVVPDDDPCGCRAAHRAASAAYQRAAYAKKRAAAGHPPPNRAPAAQTPPPAPTPTPAVVVPTKPMPRLEPIAHGTTDGWRAHHERGALPVCDPCADANSQRVGRAAVSSVELDVWFAAAQLSPSRSVQRAARAASTALLQLHQAMDELCRAERAAVLPDRAKGATV